MALAAGRRAVREQKCGINQRRAQQPGRVAPASQGSTTLVEPEAASSAIGERLTGCALTRVVGERCARSSSGRCGRAAVTATALSPTEMWDADGGLSSIAPGPRRSVRSDHTPFADWLTLELVGAATAGGASESPVVAATGEATAAIGPG